MYDIDTKVIKKGKKFYLVFLIVGIIFLMIFGGIFVGNIIKVNSMDANVMSHDVTIKYNDEGMGMAIYEYIVNGREYTCSNGTYSNPPPSSENKLVYYDKNDPSNCAVKSGVNLIWLIALLLPIVFIVIAVLNFKKINKRIKDVEELNKNGKLVKNLPYQLENTGMSVNNRQIQRPVVNYQLSTGSVIKLYGDPRHDGKTSDADGYVDLVIDENNPDKYFIDFEINRLSGNVPEDYFVQSNEINNLQMSSEQQPVYDQQQIYYNQQPTYDQQQMYYNQQPTYDQQQMYYNQQPTYAQQQMYYNQQPVYDQQQMYYNQQPTYDQQQMYYNQQPTYAQQQMYYNQQPTYDQQQMYYNQQPTYDQQQMYYNQQSTYDQQQMYYNQQPVYEQPQINNNPQPVYEQQITNIQQPVYNQQQSTIENVTQNMQ